MKHLSPHDVRRLAVACHRCPAAIHNVILGKAKPTVDRQVREEAKRLGIELPGASRESSAA